MTTKIFALLLVILLTSVSPGFAQQHSWDSSYILGSAMLTTYINHHTPLTWTESAGLTLFCSVLKECGDELALQRYWKKESDLNLFYDPYHGYDIHDNTLCVIGLLLSYPLKRHKIKMILKKSHISVNITFN